MIIIPAIIVSLLLYWYITQIIKPVNDEISKGREAERKEGNNLFDTVDPFDATELQGFSDN